MGIEPPARGLCVNSYVANTQDEAGVREIVNAVKRLIGFCNGRNESLLGSLAHHTPRSYRPSRSDSRLGFSPSPPPEKPRTRERETEEEGERERERKK